MGITNLENSLEGKHLKAIKSCLYFPIAFSVTCCRFLRPTACLEENKHPRIKIDIEIDIQG